MVVVCALRVSLEPELAHLQRLVRPAFSLLLLVTEGAGQVPVARELVLKLLARLIHWLVVVFVAQ